tara:strand:- start:905 stop:1339 length:435 start_codon:yes stop_codon:yes gene_type:complete
MYEYKVKIKRIVDGDTVDVDIDLGFHVWLYNQRIRLHGIDTPECRTSDKTEKIFGNASKDFVEKNIPVGSTQILKSVVDKKGDDKRGKFGRILGDFILPNKSMLTENMIKKSFAVPYTGGNKDKLESLHNKNREKLISKGKVVV